jgi:hypothetical protein
MEFKEYLHNNLNPEFNKKEVEKIENIINKSFNEFNENNPEQKSPNIENKGLSKFLETLAEKPEYIKDWIKEARKPDWTKSVLKVVIALIVILPISILSYNGILGICETSTLFGGIVGYLLGDLN